MNPPPGTRRLCKGNRPNRGLYSFVRTIVKFEIQRRSDQMATTTLPDVLVTTEWVAAHASDPNVRVVEVDVDTTAYDQGHVPGSVGWNWTTELCDTTIREIVPLKKLEELLGKSGIDNNTTIVLYGDNNNW